jgi:hypothetical protein
VNVESIYRIHEVIYVASSISERSSESKAAHGDLYPSTRPSSSGGRTIERVSYAIEHNTPSCGSIPPDVLNTLTIRNSVIDETSWSTFYLHAMATARASPSQRRSRSHLAVMVPCARAALASNRPLKPPTHR